MEQEQIVAYLKILDERTRSIMENNEDASRIVKEAKEKLEFFDKSIEEMKSMLSNSAEKGDLDDKHEELEELGKRLDKIEFKFAESIDEIRQAVKLHENLIQTSRKRMENQGNSDVKLLNYDRKMKKAIIGQIIAIILSFLIPFSIIYLSMNTEVFEWMQSKADEKIEATAETVSEAINKTEITPGKEDGKTVKKEMKQEEKSAEVRTREIKEEKKPKTSTPKPVKKEEKSTNLRESETIYTDKEIQQ